MGKVRLPVFAARLRVVLAIGGLLAAMSVFAAPPVAAATGIAAQAERGTLQIHYVPTKDGMKALPTISGAMATGLREAYLASQVAGPAQAAPATAAAASAAPNIGLATRTLGCSARNSDGSVRVNQDCSYRRQAEETIRFNPANPSNLVAGQNDSRIGYNHCGIDYSMNNGQTWGDMLPPFWQKENNPVLQATTIPGDPNSHTITGMPGTDHTYDFASDPIVAVDSQGRSFFGCVVVSLGANEGDSAVDNSTGLLVAVAPPGVGGAFYNNIGADTKKYTVAEDNDPNIFHDKPFIAADFYANSPNRDNVYVTWTVFRGTHPACATALFNVDFCSPIFGSMSTDHGRTWSTPEEISGASTALCTGACNQDQGSDPIVLPDGSVVVTYNSGNTPTVNGEQLAVNCHPSGSSPAGTAHFNCGAPNLVGADVAAGEPSCVGSGECIPGANIRTNDFPRIAVNRSNGHLFVAWQDYRNQRFDIQLAASTDGGLTWSDATRSVNQDTTNDHYFPAIDVAAPPTGAQPDGSKAVGGNGDHVGISYYRTARIPNENTVPSGGFSNQPGVGSELSDFGLAGGHALSTPYAFKVLTPKFAAPDGNQAGFNGDYSGLTIVNETAHPIWSDTRNTSPFPASSPDFQGVIHDEDIFTVATRIPGGSGD